MRLLAGALALVTFAFLGAGGAAAQSFRPLPATTQPLTLGDDNSDAYTLPFSVKVGAEAPYTLVSLSQNGGFVTAGGDHVAFLSDFQARVDTGQANYGVSTVNGRPAVITTYPQVGYCCSLDGRRANAQVVIIDRSDLAAGDFDVEVNTEGLDVAAQSYFVIDGVGAGSLVVPDDDQAYRLLFTFRNGALTSATGPTLIAPVAPVPTLSEWAMILFGGLLAGGAALYVQRRRFV